MNIKEKNTGQMDKTLEALALEIDAAAEDGDISALDTLLDKCSSGLEAATGQNRVIFLFF